MRSDDGDQKEGQGAATRVSEVMAVLRDGMDKSLHTQCIRRLVLGGVIAKRDSDTNAHNCRVTVYAIRLAEELGLSELDIRSLVKGAFPHDIGKIAIRDAILLKPGSLSPQDFCHRG